MSAERDGESFDTGTLVAVMPALDEEGSVGELVNGLWRNGVDHVVVVDNGSRDRTASRAAGAGAVVVHEPRRGYGSAVLAGLDRARALGADVIVLLDADGSDPPACLPALLAALRPGVDIVLGVRDPRLSQPESLTIQQRVGNVIATTLMRVLLDAGFSDLPPFKVVRRAALDRLALDDRGHGFTIQLLLRAHSRQVSWVEVPIAAERRKAGDSKVSGTIRGTLRASLKITSLVLVHAVRSRIEARRA